MVSRRWRFIITGTPGRRDWLADVRSDPAVTVRVDGHSIDVNVEEISDAEFRHEMFSRYRIGGIRLQPS